MRLVGPINDSAAMALGAGAALYLIVRFALALLMRKLELKNQQKLVALRAPEASTWTRLTSTGHVVLSLDDLQLISRAAVNLPFVRLPYSKRSYRTSKYLYDKAATGSVRATPIQIFGGQ